MPRLGWEKVDVKLIWTGAEKARQTRRWGDPKPTKYWNFLWVLSNWISFFWEKAVFWIPLKRSESNFDDNYRVNLDYGFARGGGACLIYTTSPLTLTRIRWITSLNFYPANGFCTMECVCWLESWLMCCLPAFYFGCFVLGDNHRCFIVVVIISEPRNTCRLGTSSDC
jgi:hypothetical protein